MHKLKRSVSLSFLTLGIIFLVIGFVQQGLSLSFESGFFSLGVIFALSGLAAYFFERTLEKQK